MPYLFKTFHAETKSPMDTYATDKFEAKNLLKFGDSNFDKIFSRISDSSAASFLAACIDFITGVAMAVMSLSLRIPEATSLFEVSANASV